MKILTICNSLRAALKHSALALAAATGIGAGGAFAAPANDNFANAIILTGNAGIQTGTNNNGATLETDEFNDAGGTNTVWFKWHSPSSGMFSFMTDGSTNLDPGEWDAAIGIYTGFPSAATKLGTTVLDTGDKEHMTVAVAADTDYYIQLAGYNAQEASNILLTWNFIGPAQILTFGPGATVGTLTANAATVTWNQPLGTNKSNLAPTFTLSSDATCTIGGIPFTSGETINLTDPVDFVITALGDSPIVNTYTVSVNLIAPSGIINVSYERDSTPDASTLVGPAGGIGQTWNQPTTPSGGGLFDSVGTPTSIGWSNTNMAGIDNWGIPSLNVLRSGLWNFFKGTTQQFVINGLSPNSYYNVWIASQQPNTEKAKGVWSTTNPTNTVGGQPIDATVTQNTSTWEAGNNFVYFDHVKVSTSGQIVFDGLSAESYRLPVNGFQLVPTTAPVNDYGTWATDYLPSDVSVSAADFDGDGLTNQQEYAFALNPTSGSSVNPIKVALDTSAGTFSYARRDPALTGLSYAVFTSTDLTTWTLDVGAVQAAGAPAAGVQTVAVTLSSALLTAPKLFVRVRAN
jgi:hypothetical protein